MHTNISLHLYSRSVGIIQKNLTTGQATPVTTHRREGTTTQLDCLRSNSPDFRMESNPEDFAGVTDLATHGRRGNHDRGH